MSNCHPLSVTYNKNYCLNKGLTYTVCIHFLTHMHNSACMYEILLSFQLLLFVTSSAVDGMMITEGDRQSFELSNGTSRADMLCQEDAEHVGLWGHYSALLSTKHNPLQNRTSEQYRHLPVVNTKVSNLTEHYCSGILVFLYVVIYMCCEALSSLHRVTWWLLGGKT